MWTLENLKENSVIKFCKKFGKFCLKFLKLNYNTPKPKSIENLSKKQQSFSHKFLSSSKIVSFYSFSKFSEYKFQNIQKIADMDGNSRFIRRFSTIPVEIIKRNFLFEVSSRSTKMSLFCINNKFFAISENFCLYFKNFFIFFFSFHFIGPDFIVVETWNVIWMWCAGSCGFWWNFNTKFLNMQKTLMSI